MNPNSRNGLSNEHPLAGQPVPADRIMDTAALVHAYFSRSADAAAPGGPPVAFGTSGHRGSSLDASFTEIHILATTQAICDFRKTRGIDGPLFIGADTHALSAPALETAMEVLGGNDVAVIYQENLDPVPTPVISWGIVTWNRTRSRQGDGIVITPSHNPPEDGGFKYNPPSGGPADTDVTRWIQDRANELIRKGAGGVRRVPFQDALDAARPMDLRRDYIADLDAVVDMDAIAASGLRLGADPMGGAGAAYWDLIAERYGIDITVVNPGVDPTFSFMRLDRDGKIRMDCSSPWAMAGLVDLKDRFDVAFGNDPDFDRHGIVTPSAGLMNPNHYLAVAVQYLFRNRTSWPREAQIGKTLVSSSMIDRVANDLGRRVAEVPVGFKWFVDGLLSSAYGFGGEESAGASFLRRDGTTWTTDKDGIIMNLLAAEITAHTGKDPGEHYTALAERFGAPIYARTDAPAGPARKKALSALSVEDVQATTVAGDPITRTLTHAPANGAAIGGVKVETENGWFAARPSGTEDIYKIYAESFVDQVHLERIQRDARRLVDDVFTRAGL